MNVVPVTIPAVEPSGIDAAYATLVATLIANRPPALRVTNTRAALEGRLCDIENISMAMRKYLKALVEDSAVHMPMDQRPDDVVEAAMFALESDLRGMFLDAIAERIGVDRREYP